MKCPHCKQHIAYPTQRQLVAWYYRYIYGNSEEETAKIMNITPRAVRSLLKRMGEVWPDLISVPRKTPVSLCQFNEELHSQEHRF